MSPDEKVIRAVQALAEIIVEAAEAGGPMGTPSGPVYAACSGYGVSLNAYQSIVAALQQQGRLVVRNDCLVAVPS